MKDKPSGKVLKFIFVLFYFFSPKGRNLDVKKSSYKKLSKFLAAMQEQGFIKVEEQTKGVESIAVIDHEHDE